MQTPLHFAIIKESIDAIKLLIKNGAKTNIHNNVNF